MATKRTKNIIYKPRDIPKKERVTVVVVGKDFIRYMPLFVVWKYDMMSIFYALYFIEFKLLC